MSGTKRQGNARDGSKVPATPARFGNNWRGYRLKPALRHKRRSDTVAPDRGDEASTKRENNRLRRAADRIAIADGIEESRGPTEEAEKSWLPDRGSGNGTLREEAGRAGPQRENENRTR